MLNIIVRKEESSHAAQISEVVERAFRSQSTTPRSEPYIVLELRRAGELTVSLVAETEGKIVGHVAFSRVQVSDDAKDWYGLGPLAVAPEFQRRGIGRELATVGLNEIRRLGAAGCVVLGNPVYYSRFGFVHRPELVLSGVPPGHFQALAFGKDYPKGFVSYHPAFQAKSPDRM
jgi:putative acetyltransferase